MIRYSARTTIAVVFALLFSSSSFAGPGLERCLGTQEARALEAELHRLVELETKSTLGTNTVASEISQAYQRIQAKPWSEEVLRCIGFKFSFLNGARTHDFHPAKNLLIAAMARLDERFWIANMRKDLPKQYKSAPLRWLLLRKDVRETMFALDSNSAGSVNPLVRSVSFSLKNLARLPETDEKSYMSQRPFIWCSSLSSTKGGTSTALHEYAHILDHAQVENIFTLAVSKTQQSPRWHDLHLDTEMTTPYGAKDPAEDFADSFSAYFLDPLFRCYAPEKAEYISEMVLANPAIYGDTVPYRKSVDCRSKAVQSQLAIRKQWARDAAVRCPKE